MNLTVSLEVVKIVVGLLLCFAGARSLLLAAGCVGFSLGAALAAALGGGLVVALIVAVAGGLGAVILTRVVGRIGLFVVGALAGGVVGVLLASSLHLDAALILLVVLALAAIGGVLLNQFRSPALAVLTAFAGAGLVLAGLGRLGPNTPLGFLRDPQTAAQNALQTVIWIALAAAGWVVQRRQVARTP
ncbi:MAG TPA: DUF4203 domain-containing protein [Pseudonocardiaceae bacterium]